MSDKKLQHSTDGTTVDYYNADIVTANDYYPGGMQMPGRKYSNGSSSYRYGFNGQEKSDEIKGEGNSYTAESWEYDPRIGRRWNIDPIVKPWESGYASFSNNPISLTDPMGLDADDPKKKSITLQNVTVVGTRRKNPENKKPNSPLPQQKFDFKSSVKYTPPPTPSGLDGVNVKPLMISGPINRIGAFKINVEKTIETTGFITEHGEVLSKMLGNKNTAIVLGNAGTVATGVSIVYNMAHKNWNGAIMDGIELGISKTAAPHITM